jgi:glycosyltransferase involved in cell wall biosynthesis
MRKIKIGYLISHLGNTGPVNILYGIIKYLDRNKFEPYIFTLKEEGKDSREKEFRELNIEILKNRINSFNIIFKNNIFLEKKIKKLRLDILHAHGLESTILLSKIKIEDSKKMTTIHCDLEKDFAYNFGQLKGAILKKLYVNSLKKIENNISCGEGIKKLNKASLGIESITIMNGIDEEKINLKNIIETKKEIRKKLGVNEEKKIFITIGLIDERKNVLFLAEVFKKYLKEHVLIIIGDGEKRIELEKLLKECKNIHYYGKKDLLGIQYYLKCSDFYISASRSEGIPNSVLEALQFNLPLILSDIEAHREIIQLNDKIGFIFENNNEIDLKKKIEKIVNLKIKMDEFEKIYKKISAKRMTNDYMKIYKKIIFGENK